MEKCKLKANGRVESERIIESIKLFGETGEEDTDSYINHFEVGDHKFTVYIEERYFYRITSTLTVTVLIDQTETDTTVEIISGGGKTSNAWGLWFTSWGAENRALKDVIAPLEQLGFVKMSE